MVCITQHRLLRSAPHAATTRGQRRHNTRGARAHIEAAAALTARACFSSLLLPHTAAHNAYNLSLPGIDGMPSRFRAAPLAARARRCCSPLAAAACGAARSSLPLLLAGAGAAAGAAARPSLLLATAAAAGAAARSSLPLLLTSPNALTLTARSLAGHGRHGDGHGAHAAGHQRAVAASQPALTNCARACLVSPLLPLPYYYNYLFIHTAAHDSCTTSPSLRSPLPR
jgi:hypothetical protein